MREIKFRGYNPATEKIIPWESMQAWTMGSLESPNISQFTGLYDRNNKPIFEGDIIEIESVFGGRITRDTVVWFRCGFETQKGGQIPRETRIRVIGNVYENPDLLTN